MIVFARVIALAVVVAGCAPERSVPAPKAAPAHPTVVQPDAGHDQPPAEPGDVASWPAMAMRTFEGSTRAFNGASTLTRYTVSLASGFVLSSSSELGATYALKAKDRADGVLVGIHMNGSAPDLDAEVARTARYKRHVTKKQQRAGGFLLETEDDVGTSYVQVALATRGETITCSVDLYTTEAPDKLVPWAETMCSTLRVQ